MEHAVLTSICCQSQPLESRLRLLSLLSMTAQRCRARTSRRSVSYSDRRCRTTMHSDSFHLALPVHRNKMNTNLIDRTCLGLEPDHSDAHIYVYQVRSPIHKHLQIERQAPGCWGHDLTTCNIEMERTDRWMTLLALQGQSASFGWVWCRHVQWLRSSD